MPGGSGPMLTIGQLARYAGVTVRAVRHYHRIGLLAEPERDSSGYRAYDAAAVVRLIRIRTLAEAGVPLARVQCLLDAEPEEFARGIADVDRRLRTEIRRLQDHRRRVAGLAAGDRLALPQSVVDYLDRVRALGVDERYIAMERDAWIMLAARLPRRIDAIIADKQRELDDPEMVALYRLLSAGVDWPADDPRIVEVADLLERLMIRALRAGGTKPGRPEAVTGGDGRAPTDELDDPFVRLMDATAANSAPAAQRLMAILRRRGWRGWTRIEQAPPDRVGADAATASRAGAGDGNPLRGNRGGTAVPPGRGAPAGSAGTAPAASSGTGLPGAEAVDRMEEPAEV